jgi:multimeric flavodoxin WrbA
VKVLGISGSPRHNGNTELLLAECLKGAAAAGAEIEMIILRDLKFATCIHCDSCLKTGNCRFQDDMQLIYPRLEAADVIVLASPVQFMGVTVPVKAMIDRSQCLWARKYLLKIPALSPKKQRKGFFISVCGTRLKNMFDPSVSIVKTWFHIIEVEYAGALLVPGIDEKGVILQHPDTVQEAGQWGRKLAEG